MTVRIRSLDDRRLDPYRELKRTNRTRDQDWFIAEGRWVVERLLASDLDVISVVLSESAADSWGRSIQRSVPIFVMPDEEVSQLVGFDFHSGIIACGRRRLRRQWETDDRDLKKNPATVVVCPHTVLPDNLGSIIRICAAFGVQALLVGTRSADPFSRRCVRVSMGNIFRLPVFEPEDIGRSLQQLKQDFGYVLLAATGSPSGCPLPMPRPGTRIALVLGNEASGIDADLLSLCDQEISIRMSGTTDSLNVANAAAILLYQFTRVAP